MFAHEDSDFLYPISFNKPGDSDYQHVLRANGELDDVPLPDFKGDDKIYSAVRDHAPDLRRFPLFPKARPRVCRIRPGQCLGIPHHMWHNIRSKEGELNLSLNFGYGDPGGRSSEMVQELAARMSEMKTRQHLIATRELAT